MKYAYGINDTQSNIIDLTTGELYNVSQVCTVCNIRQSAIVRTDKGIYHIDKCHACEQSSINQKK